jgi:hypothetical protein
LEISAPFLESLNEDIFLPGGRCRKRHTHCTALSPLRLIRAIHQAEEKADAKADGKADGKTDAKAEPATDTEAKDK